MLGVKGESKYADIIELVLFNSGLSGISIEGKNYFYANPLRMVHNAREYNAHENATETPNREPYLECFCCPPNLVRTIAKVSKWAYSLTNNGLAVNLYGGNKLATQLADGSTIKLTQKTEYPWNGQIKITIQACKVEPFEILLRIPNWAVGTKIKLNDKVSKAKTVAGTFATIKRKWQVGDTVTLEMPMPIQFIEGHPRIEEVRNQVALKRGPIVYCIETPDLPKSTSILDVYLDAKADLQMEHQTNFLGGISTIKGQILLRSNNSTNTYYPIQKPILKKYKTQFVPYFTWSNRGLTEMTVFMPIIWKG